MTAQLIVGVVVDLFHGWLPFLFAMAAAFTAAAVRGYAGFGLSALIVASMSLVLPPVEMSAPMCGLGDQIHFKKSGDTKRTSSCTSAPPSLLELNGPVS